MKLETTTTQQKEKDVFSSCHERGTKKTFLSPHEESNLRASDSVLRGERKSLHGDSKFFLVPRSRQDEKTSFSISLPSSKLTIFLISIDLTNVNSFSFFLVEKKTR